MHACAASPSADAVKYKGHVYYMDSDSEEREDRKDPGALALEGSFVAFTKNGALQVGELPSGQAAGGV